MYLVSIISRKVRLPGTLSTPPKFPCKVSDATLVNNTFLSTAGAAGAAQDYQRARHEWTQHQLSALLSRCEAFCTTPPPSYKY